MNGKVCYKNRVGNKSLGGFNRVAVLAEYYGKKCMDLLL